MGLFLGGLERRSAARTFAEPPIPPVRGGNPWGGQPSFTSNPDAALVVPTVWACVSLIANAVSMLPLQVFRRVNGIPVVAPSPQLLQQPSAGMTQSEWLHMVMVSLLLRGNAYGRITGRDDLEYPSQIDLLHPDSVRVDTDRQTGEIVYSVNQRQVDPQSIWHVRGLRLPGAPVGLSPVAYAAAALGVDVASRQFADDFFSGGGIPKAVLTTDQAVNQEQARTIKERIQAATQRRELVVLGAGLSYKQISVAPEESQFLQTQQASIGQIARYFNVPAGLVGGTEGGALTYSNVEQRSLDFLIYGVQPWLRRLEDATSALLPSRVYSKFDTAALLRTDAETQARVDVQLIAGKVKVPSEVRAERDLPPMTDAQKTEAELVPLDVTPTGGAKLHPLAPGQPQDGPGAPVPAGDAAAQQNATPIVIEVRSHQGPVSRRVIRDERGMVTEVVEEPAT